MKLIDLLVRELPKHGGWPDGMACACQSRVDGGIYFYKKRYQHSHITKGLCDFSIYLDSRSKSEGNHDGYIYVTRDQYQSALAALQKVEWSSDGLPPVGCECEYLDSNGEWYPVTIKYASDQLVVISGITKILGVEQGTEIAKDIIIDKPKFRPIRSEADKKRDAALDAIYGAIASAEREHNRSDEAGKVYEAIAAGKIPGVKLED